MHVAAAQFEEICQNNAKVLFIHWITAAELQWQPFNSSLQWQLTTNVHLSLFDEPCLPQIMFKYITNVFSQLHYD